MRISLNIKRPNNWYQGSRIVITDSFYGANMSHNPYFSTDYNTQLGVNDLPSSNTYLYAEIPDNYLKTFLNISSYRIIVYALAYDGVIDIATDVSNTYYKIGDGAETELFHTDVCLPNNGESMNENEQKFIEKNLKTNNVAYNKYYKFEIKPEKVQSGTKFDNITLKFTYEYSSVDINKYLNYASEQYGGAIGLDNTIIYNGSSETFEIASVAFEDALLGNSSKLDNQMSYINYKSYAASNYSPVLSLDARDIDYTFLGWYKIHSNTQYKLGDTIQFSSLFNGFVSSQKNSTFDYNKLNNTEGDYVYFFAVYTSQRNEIIPFENRKMRIMKVY